MATTEDVQASQIIENKDTDHASGTTGDKDDNSNEGVLVYGPLSKEETEQLQREANEESTNSEDLRLFLEEMRQHMQQQQLQQQQQQVTVGSLNLLTQHQQLQQMQQHPFSTRGYGPHQVSNNMAGTNNVPKKSMAAPEPDNVLDASPDGGWGWVVVLASFVCMILVEGLCLSYGLLVAPTCPGNSLAALTPSAVADNRSLATGGSDREVDKSGAATAASLGIILSNMWPPPSHKSARLVPVRAGACLGISEMGEDLGTQSRLALLAPGGLMVGLYILLGPLASALSNQFDFRPVAMAGCVLATVGFISASYAPNVLALNLTLGFLGGIGFGLIYLPAIATVGHWFRRRRPLAVGVALCGAGVGTIVWGQVLPRLLAFSAFSTSSAASTGAGSASNEGIAFCSTWRCTLTVMAAFTAQCLVLIVLFRPLDLHLRMQQCSRLRRQAALLVKRSRVPPPSHTTTAAAAGNSAHRPLRKQHHHALGRPPSASGVSGGGGAVVGAPRAGGTAAAPSAKASAAAMRAQAMAVARAQAAQARAAKKAIKAQKAQQRRVIYRGSIMQRIIEEKRRQRTVSIGSLDGMVITRDNELIAAPLLTTPDRPLAPDAAAIQRIADDMTRKLSARLDTDAIQERIAEAGTPLRCDSNVSQPSLLSRKSSAYGGAPALSRLNLVRESLPQLVQDYVQSQASIAVQSYIARQQRQILGHSGTPVVMSSTADAGGIPTPGAASIATANDNVTEHSFNSRIRSISNVTSVNPTGGNNTPQMQNCLSLRRTISDASITSSNRGAVRLPSEIRQEMTEIIDSELRTAVQHRLRREMLRPQYKKDLFFTGSAQQLDHTPVSAIPIGDASGGVWTARNHSSWDIGPSTTTTNNSQNPPKTPNDTKSGTNAITGSLASIQPQVPARTHRKTSQKGDEIDLEAGGTASGGGGGGGAEEYGEMVAALEKAEEEDGMEEGMEAATAEEEVEMDSMEPSRRPRWKVSLCSSPIFAFLEELLAPELLLSPTFICLLLSNVFTMWGLVVPYYMIPEMVAENNWTLQEAGSIISYIGFANTIGRIIATIYIEKAWSSHYKWLDCLRVNVASLLLAGLACAIIPLVGRNSYNLLVASGCLFGLFSAVVVSLKSILVVELFGLDKLTNAFGHMLVVQGVASIAGTVLGGYIFDVMAARVPAFVPWAGASAPLVYAAEATFLFAGGSFFLAAVFAAPLRRLAAHEVVSATIAAAGGVYVEESYDYAGAGGADLDEGSANMLPAITAPDGAIGGLENTSGSAINLPTSIQSSQHQMAVGGGGGGIPTPTQTQAQMQTLQQPPQQQQASGTSITGFDSGIASYVGEALPTTQTTSIGAAMPPTGETATVALPEVTASSLPPPTFLSPAPLPSSLFEDEVVVVPSMELDRDEMEASKDAGEKSAINMGVGAGLIVVEGGDEGMSAVGGSVVTTEAEIGEKITTAGVPMGNLPSWTTTPTSTSVVPPQVTSVVQTPPPQQTPTRTDVVWAEQTAGSSTGGLMVTTPEVKTSLVAEEPALEPVKEEEEEEEEEEYETETEEHQHHHQQQHSQSKSANPEQ